MADEDELACQGCAAPITWIEPSFACDLDCTYCTGCAEDLAYICPNCEGSLRRQPSRARGVAR